jgi:hypothetical protein
VKFYLLITERALAGAICVIGQVDRVSPHVSVSHCSDLIIAYFMLYISR